MKYLNFAILFLYSFSSVVAFLPFSKLYIPIRNPKVQANANYGESSVREIVSNRFFHSLYMKRRPSDRSPITSYELPETNIKNQNKILNNFLSSKRINVIKMINVAAVVGIIATSNCNEAQATKPRNEALCNTGFFTNIAQRMCTDIGDITEDGLSKGLSMQEKDTADDLLGKLNLDMNLMTSTTNSDTENNDKGNQRRDNQVDEAKEK